MNGLHDNLISAENFLMQWNPTGERDEQLSRFSSRYSEWISKFPSTIQIVLIELLTIFNYYTHGAVVASLKELHALLVEKHGVDHENALYTYIKTDSGKINSSIDYWLDYRRMYNIDKGFCKDDLDSFPMDQWKYVENIVIIDDCCCSGSSLEKFLNKSQKDYCGKAIFYIVVCSMRDAKFKIDELEKTHGVKIYLLSCFAQEKAFDLERIERLCDRLCFRDYSVSLGISPNYALGKYESESLMAFYNNIPNNTLGILWCSIGGNANIFERHFSKRTPWQMKAEKDRRQKANYHSAKQRESV